jgi:hypothetical protein
MFRLTHRGEGIDDAETRDGARAIVRGQPRADPNLTRPAYPAP